MSRPVHYHAAGNGALKFACYLRELRAHLDSAVMIPAVREPDRFSAERKEYQRPAPRRSTNLDAVTCRECWTEIRELARWHSSADSWGTEENIT